MTKANELKVLREKNGMDLKYREFENGNGTETIQSYYEKILTNDEIEKSLEGYKRNIEAISEEFKQKTGLQGKDVGFLMFATMLQCARIYLMNNLTKIEKANSHGGKEDYLHDVQEKIFDKFDKGTTGIIGEYFAPLNAILTMRGVPYDASNYESVKFNLFKGANHRFSTLGHDPILGLIFGTANILTNSITCFNKPIITTHHVVYDDLLKNPQIAMPGSTIAMLKAAGSRFEDDKSSVAAAVIKQLIHIATDMYTPCGIQLPGATLVLSKKNVELLTEYISTGDILKAGASAGLSILINTIISAVHGCKLLFEDDGLDYSKELYSIRTRKIILYSNLLASSSNVIATGISENLKDFDLGGFSVTCYRIFSDTHFIDKIKYEFLNSQVSKIYEDKIKDAEKYYI